MADSVRQLQHDVDVSRQVSARGSTSAGGSWGLQQTSHTGPNEGLPRRLVHGQGDAERRGMPVKLSAPRQSIGDRYRSARPGGGGADGSSGGPGGSGEPGRSAEADGPATWPDRQ
jgi:hypothetical protein